MFVIKESAADLLVNRCVIGHFDFGFIRQPLLIMVSHGFFMQPGFLVVRYTIS